MRMAKLLRANACLWLQAGQSRQILSKYKKITGLIQVKYRRAIKLGFQVVIPASQHRLDCLSGVARSPLRPRPNRAIIAILLFCPARHIQGHLYVVTVH